MSADQDDFTYKPPTDDQLVAFAQVYKLGAGYDKTSRDAQLMARVIPSNPSLKQAWLDFHWQMQHAIWEEAQRHAA